MKMLASLALDKQFSGKALASYVLAEARDHYQVAFALAEIDPAFTGNQILIAAPMASLWENPKDRCG
jgi:hypothetical protein